MASNARLRNAQQATDLTLNGVTATSVAAGPTLLMSNVEKGTLSAKTVTTAETNTITLTVIWEVSDDATTWVRVKNFTNTAPTVVGTGTAGADSAVTQQNDAPSAVYGKRYARCSILVGVTTGASSDLANVSYDYVQDQGF
jgi:hypothetical protein